MKSMNYPLRITLVTQSLASLCCLIFHKVEEHRASLKYFCLVLCTMRYTMCTIFNAPWLCSVTPFTSCPFSLLVHAAVLPRKHHRREGFKKLSSPRSYASVQIMAQFWYQVPNAKCILVYTSTHDLYWVTSMVQHEAWTCSTLREEIFQFWEPAQTNIPFPAGSLISSQMDAPLNGFFE